MLLLRTCVVWLDSLTGLIFDNNVVQRTCGEASLARYGLFVGAAHHLWPGISAAWQPRGTTAGHHVGGQHRKNGSSDKCGSITFGLIIYRKNTRSASWRVADSASWRVTHSADVRS